MFTSFADSYPPFNVPIFETRKALIILNLQNDSFDTSQELVICEPHDFVEKIKAMVPYFRKTGDIVWVRTEFQEIKSAGPSTAHAATQRLQVDDLIARQCELTGPDDEGEDDGTQLPVEASDYFPSSRSKAAMRRASAKTRSDQRKELYEVFNAKPDDDVDAYVHKPRKGQPPQLYRPGTHGAAITDDVLPFVDEVRDLIIVKQHYSALDATPLLMSLRMKLVTHVYLCGLLSNVSIYATAADAVRHGFEVTVVEDCLGYRSEAKHIDAMRQMADILGVSGIDSEEIIDESGGREPPDTEVGFTGPGYDGIQGTPGNTINQAFNSAEHKTNYVGEAASASPTQNFKKLLIGAQSVPVATQGCTVQITARVNTVQDNQTEETVKRPESEPQDPRPSTLGDPPSVQDFTVGRNTKSTLGPGDSLGDGDSEIVYDALSSLLKETAFSTVKHKADWQTMHHRNGEVPRKVAVQGEVGKDGITIPIYRHPADESPPLQPFTAMVNRIRAEVQKLLQQPFNHALIQLYRDGQDNISEHSDKTLDIVRGTCIVNVSLGAQRVMTLRTKKTTQVTEQEGQPTARQTQRIPMPHNSIFILGPKTNRRWLHGIRADKRRPVEKLEEEKAFGGERISITFRQIGTFTETTSRKIWGQGARSKTRKSAGTVSANSSEMESMIIAFGNENHQADFDWDAEYGAGFNVVDLATSVTQLFLCKDDIANLRVKLAILERRVSCKLIRGNVTGPVDRRGVNKPKTIFTLSGNETPVFRDVDKGSSEVVGDLAILFYLGKFYPNIPKGQVSAKQIHRLEALAYTRVTQANELLYLWQEVCSSSTKASTEESPIRHRNIPGPPDVAGESPLSDLEAAMEIWEGYAEATDYVGGDFYTIIDCAFWPVLNDIVHKWEDWSEGRYPYLTAYYHRVAAKESVKEALAYTVE